jgi:hypothetical protein
MLIFDLSRRREESQAFFRPWQLALFADCASQDLWFLPLVLGQQGLQNLISGINQALSHNVLENNVPYDQLAEMLLALASLSCHTWVAEAIEPAFMGVLVKMLRCVLPHHLHSHIYDRMMKATHTTTMVLHPLSGHFYNPGYCLSLPHDAAYSHPGKCCASYCTTFRGFMVK